MVAGMQTDDEQLTISQAVERYGVTARALRFYETKGLLAPERRPAGRLYGPEDQQRLDVIVRARRLGISLDAVKAIFDLHDHPPKGRAALSAARDGLSAHVADLKARREDIDASIEDLSRRIAHLDDQIAAAPEDDDTGLRQSAADFARLGKSWLWGDPPSAQPDEG